MTSNIDYAGYWDKKLEYFRKTEDLDNPRADVPGGDILFDLIDLMDIQPGSDLLDLGCGYGRLFPYFLEKGARVCGVDVSPRMLTEAEKKYGAHADVDMHLMNAEVLDLPDRMFDSIICYGVFDALEYHYEAMAVMSRHTSTGGRILISGKHKPYHEDDEEARIAEIKAAEVNHPNFFISWAEFEKQMEKCHLSARNMFFYERRGDSVHNQYLSEAPEVFYEFNVILQKQ